MQLQNDAIEGIAADAAELRAVFEHSRFSDMAPMLRYEQYFPRSLSRVVKEEGRASRGMALLSFLVGATAAAAVVSLRWRDPNPLALVIVAAVPALVVARRWMASIFGATAETANFVELACFDRRAPVVYLRRFEGEDPPLPALTSRNSVVGGITSPARTDTLENLAHLFGAVGPVIGLGRPSDTTIDHRIHRLFTTDAHWREVVGMLVRQARAVLMVYAPSAQIDWELSQALQGRGTVLFVLIREVPEATARAGQAALAALPAAITELGRPALYFDKVSDRYPSDEHGLLAVVAPECVRVFGLKVHFQQIWDVIFEEVVHTLKIAETRSFAGVPAAYRPVVQALEGPSIWWQVLAAAAGVAAVAGAAMAM